jgi:hypothetical protein
MPGCDWEPLGPQRMKGRETTVESFRLAPSGTPHHPDRPAAVDVDVAGIHSTVTASPSNDPEVVR